MIQRRAHFSLELKFLKCVKLIEKIEPNSEKWILNRMIYFLDILMTNWKSYAIYWELSKNGSNQSFNYSSNLKFIYYSINTWVSILLNYSKQQLSKLFSNLMTSLRKAKVWKLNVNKTVRSYLIICVNRSSFWFSISLRYNK